MPPITWKNVNSGSNSAAVALLDRAGSQVNRGLTSLQDTLRGVQQGRQRRYEIQQESNSEDYRNFLAGYQSPEALQRAQETGAIEAFRQQLQGPVDAAVIRNAPVERLNALRDQANTAAQYQATVQAREAAPILEAGRRLIASDDDAGFADWQQNNPDVLGGAELIGRYNQEERARLELGRSDDRFQREEDARRTQEGLRGLYAELINNGNLTATQAANQLRTTAYQQFPDATPQQVASLVQALGQEQLAMEAMAPADQANYDEIARRGRETYFKGNPYMAFDEEGYNPAAAATQMWQGALESNPELADAIENDEEREGILSRLQAAIDPRRGIMIDGERVPVAPDIARLTLNQVSSDWLQSETSFESLLNNALLSNGGAEQYQNYKDGHELLRNLEAQYPQSVRNGEPLTGTQAGEKALQDASRRTNDKPLARPGKGNRPQVKSPREQELDRYTQAFIQRALQVGELPPKDTPEQRELLQRAIDQKMVNGRMLEQFSTWLNSPK